MLKIRLKQAREKAGLTQSRLAEALDSSQGSIYKIENGITVRPRNIDKIAKVLKVTPEWLQFGNGGNDLPSQSSRVRMVPVLSWVQAGGFREPVTLELYDVEDRVPCLTSSSERTFALKVKGDSMTAQHLGERSYPPGIIILVDPEKPVYVGCRVIAQISDANEATFKTYVEDCGRQYLKPIDPMYPMIEITPKVRICGVVIGSYWPE